MREHIFAVFFYLSPLEGIGDFTGFTIAVNVDIAGSTATTAGTEDWEILDMLLRNGGGYIVFHKAIYHFIIYNLPFIAPFRYLTIWPMTL